ncbi:MAG: diacylglycerol kinase family protein [Xanthobacteraceae bacterium]|jgi:diacylglycerol kinase family enzyme
MALHPPQRSPTCILNGASSHVDAARAHLDRISGELGVAARVVVARRGDDISRLAARAVEENGRPVVAGGGDGTISAVAAALVGTDTALGVLPIGTLNHFAKDLGIPLGLEAAVRNVFTGQIAKVDVGEINGRVFVNNSSIGLYPRIVRQREEEQRHGHVKWVAFVLAVGSVLRRYSLLRVRLRTDAADLPARATPFVFVGNNRYEIAGLDIGTRMSLDSGRLWVCMAERAGRLHLVRMALRALMGRVTDHELSAFETEEIMIETATRWANVSTDGEVTVMEAPLRYRIRPRALGVVVPARSDGRM